MKNKAPLPGGTISGSTQVVTFADTQNIDVGDADCEFKRVLCVIYKNNNLFLLFAIRSDLAIVLEHHLPVDGDHQFCDAVASATEAQ